MSGPDHPTIAEVERRFTQWLETPDGTLDDKWALNLLLGSLYCFDRDGFAVAAYEHGFTRRQENTP